MAIGKEKKSVQTYVKLSTKKTIATIAKSKKVSESKLVGDVLDEAFSPTAINK